MAADRRTGFSGARGWTEVVLSVAEDAPPSSDVELAVSDYEPLRGELPEGLERYHGFFGGDTRLARLRDGAGRSLATARC